MNETDMMKGLMLISSLDNCNDTANSRGEVPPPPEKPCPQTAAVIRLPEPGLLDDKEMSFLELIELRATIRNFSDKPITLKELSFMLWCTQGVKMMNPNGTTIRNVPSAGARHALETYLYLGNVEGVEPGIYRFLALGHALETITTEPEQTAKFLAAFKSKAVVDKCAAVFLWVAEYDRMTYKFGQRACRYVFLDAGHVCQNLYLAAYTQQIGTCALGSFNETEIGEILALNSDNEFPLYGAAVGKPEL